MDDITIPYSVIVLYTLLTIYIFLSFVDSTSNDKRKELIEGFGVAALLAFIVSVVGEFAFITYTWWAVQEATHEMRYPHIPYNAELESQRLVVSVVGTLVFMPFLAFYVLGQTCLGDKYSKLVEYFTDSKQNEVKI
ncbi:MAG: hypothetical protein LBM93_06265 [Oscillospiraceae bacterium]|jgi:hypothetical protein|nr:hypothetical protein [Oscillospiraceae bacterium]